MPPDQVKHQTTRQTRVIHRETPSRRQKPTRDHPLPQTPHRPRDLPPVNQPTPNT